MDTIKTNELIRKLESKLARQKAAFEDTSSHLADLTADDSIIDGKANTITQLRARQLRQHNNYKATEAYLTFLRQTTSPPKKGRVS